MHFESFVAFRYLRSKRKKRVISLITLISVAGVTVGVMALIVVMSVMTGFDQELQAAIIGNRAHLVVREYGNVTIGNPSEVIAQVKAVAPEVAAAAPVSQTEGILHTYSGDYEHVSGGWIIGIDPKREQSVTNIADYLTDKAGRQFGEGRLPLHEKEIVLGYRLAQKLNAYIGDEVEVITPKSSITPYFRRGGQGLWMTVVGISEAQMFDYDTYGSYVTLDTMAMLTGRHGVDAIHCRLNDPNLVNVVADRIETALEYQTSTWYESQQEFFATIQQEKLAMFIILTFIILVAAFNIMSTLIMVVMEKRQDIGILRTLGVSSGGILRIFVIEGLFIGISGTLIGVLAGTVLAYKLTPVAEFVAGIFGIDLFNAEFYKFDHIPVAIVPWDIFWITICATILTFLSTLYPAWSASRLDPIEALRYE